MIQMMQYSSMMFFYRIPPILWSVSYKKHSFELLRFHQLVIDIHRFRNTEKVEKHCLEVFKNSLLQPGRFPGKRQNFPKKVVVVVVGGQIRTIFGKPRQAKAGQGETRGEEAGVRAHLAHVQG
jgi:hypothetical protein